VTRLTGSRSRSKPANTSDDVGFPDLDPVGKLEVETDEVSSADDEGGADQIRGFGTAGRIALSAVWRPYRWNTRFIPMPLAGESLTEHGAP
jgi:hypothetical protein